ncbi:MAG: hypothetical protein Q9218_003989 [Villophora microphyllina]
MESAFQDPLLSLRGGGASLKRKEARKRKFDQFQGPIAGSNGGRATPKDKSRKESIISERLKSRTTVAQVQTVNGAVDNTDLSVCSPSAQMDEESRNAPPAEQPEPSKHTAQRFIVFVGNLPYSATEGSIRHHFASLAPVSVRHRCDKDSGRSRGFAFLEFSNFDRMKTCLKTLHHSSFEDGISPARLINVELTAGGGGSKSEDRRFKLKAKNEKLRQERARRRLEQNKMKKGSKESQREVPQQSDNQDVHPSRKARVTALR